ncbi:MAG: efflux RND transporter permease subunit, partial [Pseudomonadota bacterium]
FGAFPTLTPQFFPLVDRDQFYVQVKLAEGAAINRTREVADEVDTLMRSYEGITTIDWAIGESAPAFYYNMVMDQDGVATFAEALVTTSSEDATNRLIPELQTRLDADVPEAQIIVRDLVQGPPVAAPVELRLVGPDLEELRRLGDETRAIMAAVPQVTHTKASLLGGAPKLVFALDEDKVRLAGLELGDVARQLDAALEGVTGGSLIEGTEELPVRVRLDQASRGAAERIATLNILPPNAASLVAEGGYPGIPLTALGEMRLLPSESPISRRNGERINNVQAFIEMGVLPEAALSQVQDQLGETPLSLPPGYRIEWGGDTDARDQTINNLMSSMGLILAGLVITIVVTFNSYRLAGIAALVCVLSMGLSVLTLAIFNYPFGIQALIGVIGSIGVSINAAIIIMTALQEDEGSMAGDLDAMTDVVTGASRHITSTTITTFGGFLPLILAGGGFWPPFAMAIAGGVLLSSIMSFYFVPPMFRIAMIRRSKRSAEPADATVSLLRPQPEAA